MPWLQGILPRACCTVIIGSQYEPIYECNILGLDRSIPIPGDMDPQSFILLDICMTTFEHSIPTPPTSLPGDHLHRTGIDPISQCYQADWSDNKLQPDLTNLPALLKNVDLSKVDDTPGVDTNPPPSSMPGKLYSPSSGFKAQRRIYLLQAGEEPPDALSPQQPTRNPSESNGHSKDIGGGRRVPNRASTIYTETMNSILDLRLPKAIELARISILRDEWTR